MIGQSTTTGWKALYPQPPRPLGKMIPTYQECMLPFLKILADGEHHAIREVIDRIADQHKLTDEERSELLSSGQRTIANRVGWARTYLKKAGLLDAPSEGFLQSLSAAVSCLTGTPMSSIPLF